MKKKAKTKLNLKRARVRKLEGKQLNQAAGGAPPKYPTLRTC